MKYAKSMMMFYLTAMLVLVAAPTVFAGNGQGAMDGSGPLMNITDGVPVEVSGVVSEIGTQGAGMSVDTGSEIVAVFGIGPQKYWDAAGIARPEVGEEVTVSGYEVTLSDGTTRIIAAAITVGGETITLRDATTGAPLWRGMKGNGAGQGNMARNQAGV